MSGPDDTAHTLRTLVDLLTQRAAQYGENLAFTFSRDGDEHEISQVTYGELDRRAYFHHIAKQTLDQHGQDLYERFSKNAKEYFYIPHRKKERGVGGLFFDHYYTGNWEQDTAMWKAVGETFLDAIMPIYEKRIGQAYTEPEREMQQQMRAHYVEFNLLYDRGTKFGFLSGGNPEAILCSLPPIVKW